MPQTNLNELPPSTARERRLLPRRTELPLLFLHPFLFARRYAVLLSLLLVSAVADGVTTYRNLLAFGPGIEVHPAQRLVFELLGPHAGVPVAKFVQLAFVLLVAAWWRPWCKALLLICSILYAAAAVSNHFHLL